MGMRHSITGAELWISLNKSMMLSMRRSKVSKSRLRISFILKEQLKPLLLASPLFHHAVSIRKTALMVYSILFPLHPHHSHINIRPSIKSISPSL